METFAGYPMRSAGKTIFPSSSQRARENTTQNGTQSEAENAIKNAGFTVGQITEEETAELDGGHVLRQYPAADTEMELNSPIDLIMSKAKTMVPIPSLNGMTLENAQAALDAVGLVIGQIGSEETNEYAEGTVARQYPAADVKVEPGSTRCTAWFCAS